MITVAKYASKEEAFIAKALLEAAEIQVFLDDGEYSDTKAVALRVPEENAERARAILADREETIRGVNGSETSDGGTRKEALDMLLFIKSGGLWIFGYLLLAMLLRGLGMFLPLHPIPLGFVFLVGGLIGLIFGRTGKRSTSSR